MEENGEKALTRRGLSDNVKERGVTNQKSTGGRFYWMGTRLRRAEEME